MTKGYWDSQELSGMIRFYNEMKENLGADQDLMENYLQDIACFCYRIDTILF